MRTDGPIQPLGLVLADGEERKFFLSAGALERIQQRRATENLTGIKQAVLFLYESLFPASVRKNTDLEDFMDLIPGDDKFITDFVAQLYERSTGRPLPATAPQPVATLPAQDSTPTDSGQSPSAELTENISDLPQ